MRTKKRLTITIFKMFKGTMFHLGYFLLLIYLFVAVLGLYCRAGFSLGVVSGVYSLVAPCGLLLGVASLVGEHGL